MTKQLTEAIRLARTLSEDAQDRVAQILLAFAHGIDEQVPLASPLSKPGATLRAALRTRLGDDIFMSWFHTLELEGFDGQTVTVSVPLKFLLTWIKSHWSAELLDCCRTEFAGAQQVNLTLRQPRGRIRERLHREIDRS